MKNNLKKAFIWNTLGSGLYSFNSLFFMIVVTRINGVEDAGIFTFCFATACLFYVIATYSGRTYQVTENDNKINDNAYIMHRVISSILMIICVLTFALINGYAQAKFIVLIILCLYKVIEALSDVFHGILQKNDRLDIVGKSLFIRSLLNLIIFLITDLFTKNIIISCISLVVTNVIILLLIDFRCSMKYKTKEKYKFEVILKIFKYGFYTFGYSIIANYLVNSSRYAMDGVLSEKYQTIFGIIVMPATIIMLINQFIIQPLITSLKTFYKQKNKKAFLNIVYKISALTILTGLFSIIVAYFIGIPVLNIVYGLNLTKYLPSLIIILIGAIFYTLASVFSNALLVLRKTKIQLLLYIISAVFTYITSYVLIRNYGFNGAIYNYLLTMILLCILYIVSFIIINNKKIWSE